MMTSPMKNPNQYRSPRPRWVCAETANSDDRTTAWRVSPDGSTTSSSLARCCRSMFCASSARSPRVSNRCLVTRSVVGAHQINVASIATRTPATSQTRVIGRCARITNVGSDEDGARSRTERVRRGLQAYVDWRRCVIPCSSAHQFSRNEKAAPRWAPLSRDVELQRQATSSDLPSLAAPSRSSATSSGSRRADQPLHSAPRPPSSPASPRPPSRGRRARA